MVRFIMLLERKLIPSDVRRGRAMLVSRDVVMTTGRHDSEAKKM